MYTQDAGVRAGGHRVAKSTEGRMEASRRDFPYKLAGRVTDQGFWDFSELTDLAGKCYDTKLWQSA
jgi:hypothetical protein